MPPVRSTAKVMKSWWNAVGPLPPCRDGFDGGSFGAKKSE